MGFDAGYGFSRRGGSFRSRRRRRRRFVTGLGWLPGRSAVEPLAYAPIVVLVSADPPVDRLREISIRPYPCTKLTPNEVVGRVVIGSLGWHRGSFARLAWQAGRCRVAL